MPRVVIYNIADGGVTNLSNASAEDIPTLRAFMSSLGQDLEAVPDDCPVDVGWIVTPSDRSNQGAPVSASNGIDTWPWP